MSAAVSHEVEIAPFTHIVRGPYTISSRGVITDEQATRFVQLLRSSVDEPTHAVLGGRGQSRVLELPQLGRVFVKRYSHGGFFRAITGGRFLCIGPCRSESEFTMLEKVRACGVNAPKPIAFIKKGSTVFSTWLVMEELAGARSLVEIQEKDSDEMLKAMDALAVQMGILVKHNIFHVDLHPGNVLVAPSGEVYLVDFDKAITFRGSSQALRDLYLRRWRRAVIKHKLSPVLSEMMSLTLRSYDE
jgi:tRNA A-37 threonylcarbamoyl transferase component Bud32